MYAITVPSPGGPEAMQWSEVPDPAPGTGEVLIDVVASAVNRADIMQREGSYPPPPGASPYLGLECSGRIGALGEGVAAWTVGDEVCALLAGGGYAEQVAVPVAQVMPVPRGVSLVDAAGLPEVACTVWSNVFMAARLHPGEVFLVHGGSSGIGTMAIQLAARHGATVCCTAGSAAKLERCRELGADVVVNYRDDDFVARVSEATDGHGADVILDSIGAAYLGRNVETLAMDGRLVVIGMQRGRIGELDLGALLAKRASVSAAGLRARPADQKAEIVAAVVGNVWPAIESGDVQVVVDHRVPMQRAADAHRAVEASGHIGKVLLTR
ncbi:MAG: NADPH:quinone oxidoreductase [Pseudonocardiales bacterium]|nr:MAG: NADPH:quinone oxidoreductase [Pseudonocardiales bacterium]